MTWGRVSFMTWFFEYNKIKTGHIALFVSLSMGVLLNVKGVLPQAMDKTPFYDFFKNWSYFFLLIFV